jgi:hypothetical protein
MAKSGNTIDLSMYHPAMRRVLTLLTGVAMLLPCTALARRNVVPANPATRDAVQVPLSFLAYEKRTGDTEYSAGVGTDLRSWLLGGTLRYHQTDPWSHQLVHERGPSDALELEATFGNSGNLFADLKLEDLCSQQGLKAEDCVFSNLDSHAQETYRKRGPLWDAPLLVLLSVGGSYQDLIQRDPADRSVERSRSLWGARGRLAVGAYLGSALLGLSGGAATLGAAPSQVTYCTPLGPAEFACTPTHLESFIRTTVFDARLEWRQAVDWLAFNPAVKAVFQKSKRDDPATGNDDTRLGLRYVDFELPVYFYVHRHDSPAFYAGLRGVLRWWQVDRPRQVDLFGGFFISLAYGGAERRASHWHDILSLASVEASP